MAKQKVHRNRTLEVKESVKLINYWQTRDWFYLSKMFYKSFCFILISNIVFSLLDKQNIKQCFTNTKDNLELLGLLNLKTRFTES